MRAYDLAMTLIFVNCAFPILDEMGITPLSTLTNMLFINMLTAPIFTVAGFQVTSLLVLAGIMATATIVLLNSNAITDRGIAMLVFTVIFWGSLGTASVCLLGMIGHFEGFVPTIFYTVFVLASTLIFFNALVQFPTGGQGAHV